MNCVNGGGGVHKNVHLLIIIRFYIYIRHLSTPLVNLVVKYPPPIDNNGLSVCYKNNINVFMITYFVKEDVMNMCIK